MKFSLNTQIKFMKFINFFINIKRERLKQKYDESKNDENLPHYLYMDILDKYMEYTKFHNAYMKRIGDKLTLQLAKKQKELDAMKIAKTCCITEHNIFMD